MIELALHPQPTLRRIGLVLFVPLFTLATIVILLALLGIFIAWLAIVGALVAAIIATDLAHRRSRAPLTLQHRPAD